MAELKEKSIGMAIGLNILLPGAGYMYLGKVLVGIAALLLVVGIYLTTPIEGAMMAWAGLNIVMAIDMYLLGSKRKKQAEEQGTRKCPRCAETIKKDAKVCRFCNAAVEEDSARPQ